MKPNETEDLVTFQITFDKDDEEELGMNIYEKFSGSGVYIGHVFKGSKAAREQLVTSGDRILKLNHIDVEKATKEEVAEMFKQVTGSVSLLIERSKTPKPDMESSSYIASLLSNIEHESLKVEHSHNNQRATYEYEKGPNHHFVEIAKSPSQSLGINIAGGAGSPLGNIPVIVTLVDPAGAAAGKLFVGDKILSINGQTTDRRNHDEVVWMIKGSTDAIVLMKVRRGDADVKKLVQYLTETVASVSKLMSSSFEMEFEVTPQITQHEQTEPKKEVAQPSKSYETRRLKITLEQTADGLGFSVVGGIGSIHGDLPIFVKSIFESGAAAREGQLRMGDRILAVNGESLDGCTHAEGVAILKKISGRAVLDIIRS